MRADLHIRDAVVVTSVVVLALLMGAPVAGAADEPKGSGAPLQQAIGAPATPEQSQAQREVTVPGELGKGQEQPMKVPEWIKITPSDDYSHLLNLGFKGQVPNILEQMWEDDEKSATSF
jgi:hypothetical protein